MALSLEDARANAAAHRPAEGRPGVCPVCTRLGVGNHQGPVLWPCDPYRSAVPVLRAAGEQRLLVPDVDEDPAS